MRDVTALLHATEADSGELVHHQVVAAQRVPDPREAHGFRLPQQTYAGPR